jgi:hypothetical protein
MLLLLGVATLACWGPARKATGIVEKGGGAHPVWLWVELFGLPVYAGLAVAGLKRSPWFLVAGIAAHGVGWDSWHYLNAAYIPTWYVTGCLLVDVSLGLYLATRVPAWRDWERTRTAHVRGQGAHSHA